MKKIKNLQVWKYILRILVVIPWSIIGLIHLFRAWFIAIGLFMKHGGEQITYNAFRN